MNIFNKGEKLFMKKKADQPAPNVSGTFQIADEERQGDLIDVQKSAQLDEESMYYARLFMED
jgi:hypothetical protein